MIVVECRNIVVGKDHMFCIDVTSSQCRGLWLCIYHSPNASDAEFLDRFENVEELLSLNKPMKITGDFNINIHDSNPVITYRARLKRFEYNTSMKQLVKSFTRVTATSKTIVDLVFSDTTNLIVNVYDDEIVADHKMILISKRQDRKNYI